VLSAAGIESAELEASLLLAEACGVERSAILAGKICLTLDQVAVFKAMLRRRAAREPIAYILRHKEFFSLEFFVSPAVLIPRPETELLVEAALRWSGERAVDEILDLGTGSGAIAIALAVHLPKVHIVGVDISTEALALARRNAMRHGVLDRIDFVAGDLWKALEQQKYSGLLFNIIVSNPPYVPEDQFEELAPEIKNYEPKIALLGGPDGLFYHRRIAYGAKQRLVPGGLLLLEVGQGQAERVAQICLDAGARKVERLKDLAGIERVVSAQF